MTHHPPLIFSGIQPTGDLHLGNYLGAIKPWVELQTKYPCIYCLVDSHAITVFQEPSLLKQHTNEVTAAIIASGIDPDKHIVFAQSSNPHHAELAWIFSCVARMGWLTRMTQFKEKTGKNRERASLGLFAYPTLMAADVLLYHANMVPVGDDQSQHLELANDIAQKFNHDFNIDFFPTINPIIQSNVSRVMSLRDGNQKMSKSSPSPFSRINLKDDDDLIRDKIKKAKTDNLLIPENKEELKDRPEALNLITILASISDQSIQETLNETNGSGFAQVKEVLADRLIQTIAPLRKEMNKILNDQTYINNVLKKGNQQAIEKSLPIITRTKEIVGFLTP